MMPVDIGARGRIGRVVVGCAAALLVCGSAVARATTIAVDTTADDTATNGNCTLREAVIAANSDAPVDACAAGSGADVISVPAGIYVLTLVGAGEDAAATGDLDLTTDVEIQGASAASTIIDGNLTDRVFDVDPGASGITAQLSAVTIQNGSQVGEGGGIRNGGTLTLTDSTVIANRAVSNVAAKGGGIRNSASLSVLRSRLLSNVAESTVIFGSARGAGIYNDGSTSIADSTLDDNSAVVPSGGGMAGGGVYSSGPLAITGTTISNNTAGVTVGFGAGFGGAIYSDGGGLTLTNSTLSGNTVDALDAINAAGGGLALAAGTAAISNSSLVDNLRIVNSMPFSNSGITVSTGAAAIFRNTIVDDGCDSYPLYDGAVIGNAYNIQKHGSCNFSGTDLTAVDPLLGPLQDNGGPTLTHAPLPGSPAIEGGDPGVPGSGGTACEAGDQRGVSRPQRLRCDVGAVEVDPCPATPLAGCLAPAKSLLLIKDRDADGASAKDKLIWKWLKGPAAMQSDFGDPTAATNYTLCLYNGLARPLAQAFIPGGDTCAALPCWKAIDSKGYRRRDPVAGAAGVSKALLKGGPKSKIIVKGKGSNLDLSPDTLPLGGTVTVQISNSSNATCWQSTFAAAAAKKNSDTLFKAKSQ